MPSPSGSTLIASSKSRAVGGSIVIASSSSRSSRRASSLALAGGAPRASRSAVSGHSRGETALEQQRAQNVPDVVGRAQALDDPRAAAGVLDHDQLARGHGQTGAPPERELLALVEERTARRGSARGARRCRRRAAARPPRRSQRQLARHGRRAVTRRRVFTVTSGSTPRPCRLRPFGRQVLGDRELHGAAAGHRHDGLDRWPCRTCASRRSWPACSRADAAATISAALAVARSTTTRAVAAEARIVLGLHGPSERVRAGVRDDPARARGRRRPS